LAAIYLPLTTAVALGVLFGGRKRQFAACLLSLLWVAPSLVLLQALNLQFGWWGYGAGSVAELRGMPLELWVGWVVLWGVVPQFCLPALGLVRTAGLMVLLDCVGMPLCAVSVRLGPRWGVGETVAVLLVLLPALCVGDWTRRQVRLGLRAGFQVATAGLLFLYFVPEVIFAVRPGAGWGAVLRLAGWERQAWGLLVFCLAVPGISAVMEFVERGGGTPIPYDPPMRLVVTGVYRYVANPMQLSCALVMVTWAGMLRNGWMLLVAGISIVYSAGIAAWDEAQDLRERFGEGWVRYRGEVRDWRVRLLPYAADSGRGAGAVVYFARGCEVCSEVRAWVEARGPAGLRILDAEMLPQGSITRMRYVGADGYMVDGVRAMGRVLEHLHVGWAWCGAVLRLPGVWWVAQAAMDTSGLGPREVCAWETELK
jgi:protein-S-isoprenylcysteine O-methyltransferase Ste14